MHCSISELAEIAGGKALLFRPQTRICSLLTDSRSLVTDPKATLFFALRTNVGDGHDYIQDLYDKGIRNFVVSNIPQHVERLTDCNMIVVNSPLESLHRIGIKAREGFSGHVVGITGSSGKTTLKEYLFQALDPLCEVYRSPRSYNSRIGIPLSLWRLPSSSEGTALIEAGISAPGEMEGAESAIHPEIVVFTNIDAEHDEGFKSREQKANEKAIFTRNARYAVFNTDDSLIADAIEKVSLSNDSLIRFRWSRTEKNADILITSEIENDRGTQLSYVYNEREYSLSLPFTHTSDIENCINSLAVMLLLGYKPKVIASRLMALHKVDTRLDVAEGVNDCKLIYDAFTHDPSSLETALDFLKRRADGLNYQRTLILSDIRCESHQGNTTYSDVAQMIAAAGIDKLYCVGKALKHHASLFPSSTRYFEDTADFVREVSTSDFAGEIILLKGAPEFGFDDIRTNLESRTHETVLEVNLDAIVKNFNYFRSHLPKSTGIVCMVKASGYGAGSVEIAKTLQEHGAAYLVVAVLDEGIELRRSGITMPIMVMNPKVLNYKAMFAYNLEPEIYCEQMLDDVIREAAKCGLKDYPIHIKLDTGMHRMGFNEEELEALADKLRNCTEVKPASAFSHLATADCPDMDDYTLLQLQRFEKYTQYLLDHCGTHFKRHILNSAGMLRFPQYHYDMARLGIGLYGANTLPPEMEKPLACVSTLRTVVIAVKEREAGETVGYARRGILNRRSRIATIPIGYADGMNRHFGNGHSCVWINGHLAPTIGNICMDACMIDVTDIPCRAGDAVEIFGAHIPVQRLADILDTIPYEVLTSVSPRVKRIYYRE